MEIEKATLKHRIIANASLLAVAALLVLTSRQVESVVATILPGVVVNWMISNERRLAEKGPEMPSVPWPTRAMLFVVLPMLSLAVIAFWFPVYAKNWNPWGIYAVASFSLALLFVKIYERYLLIRKRMMGSDAQNAESQRSHV